VSAGALAVVGLGPGDAALLTPQARALLDAATDAVGYGPYLARLAPRAGLAIHASDNREELDYYLLPWLDLPRQEIRLCNRTSIAFEAFRFEDLGFFYGMAERVGIRRKWG